MIRGIRALGALLVLLGLAIAATCVALQFDEGLTRSLAANSTCNYEPCTPEQLASMALYVGPICFLVLGGFGLAMLKARVVMPDAP